MSIITRRSLLVGLGALVAAPAIVRVANIMPVKVMAPDVFDLETLGLPQALLFGLSIKEQNYGMDVGLVNNADCAFVVRGFTLPPGRAAITQREYWRSLRLLPETHPQRSKLLLNPDGPIVDRVNPHLHRRDVALQSVDAAISRGRVPAKAEDHDSERDDGAERDLAVD